MPLAVHQSVEPRSWCALFAVLTSRESASAGFEFKISVARFLSTGRFSFPAGLRVVAAGRYLAYRRVVQVPDSTSDNTNGVVYPLDDRIVCLPDQA